MDEEILLSLIRSAHIEKLRRAGRFNPEEDPYSIPFRNAPYPSGTREPLPPIFLGRPHREKEYSPNTPT